LTSESHPQTLSDDVPFVTEILNQSLLHKYETSSNELEDKLITLYAPKGWKAERLFLQKSISW
jgi:hypothetical protein